MDPEEDSVRLFKELQAEKAVPSLNPGWEEAARKAFEEIDTDNSGSLDRKEIQDALKSLGLPNSSQYMQDLMQQYDLNKDGKVDWPEFKAYVGRKQAAMAAAFQAMDLDKSGALDPSELVKSLRQLGLPVTEHDAHKMIRLLDKDGNRVISFDEFQHFVCLLPEAQVSSNGIMCAWMDSADWVEGVEYRLCMMPPQHPLQRFIAGGVAGCISRTAVAPLERLRTMMMADPSNRRIIPTLRKMWLDGGLLGLFKGNMATVVKVMPQSALQFMVYDTCKDIMLGTAARSAGKDESVRELSHVQKVTAGCLAGAASTGLTYPLELLRTQMSMDSVAKGGYLQVARHIVQKQGWKGMFNGFQAGVTNSVITNGLGFASYEAGCQFYQKAFGGRYPTPSERGAIGGASAMFVMMSTMPFEVVMRRMQVQGRPGYPTRYANTLQCVTQIAREEGLSAFWRGSISSLMKVVPSIAATRLLYEVLTTWWGVGGIRRYRVADAT